MNTKVIRLLAEAITLLYETETVICRDTGHMAGPHVHLPATTTTGENVAAYFDREI